MSKHPETSVTSDSKLTALVAVYTGWHRHPVTGNGMKPAVRALLPELEGLVALEERAGGATPLTWLTDDGHAAVEAMDVYTFEKHLLAAKALPFGDLFAPM